MLRRFLCRVLVHAATDGARAARLQVLRRRAIRVRALAGTDHDAHQALLRCGSTCRSPAARQILFPPFRFPVVERCIDAETPLVMSLPMVAPCRAGKPAAEGFVLSKLRGGSARVRVTCLGQSWRARTRRRRRTSALWRRCLANAGKRQFLAVISAGKKTSCCMLSPTRSTLHAATIELPAHHLRSAAIDRGTLAPMRGVGQFHHHDLLWRTPSKPAAPRRRSVLLLTHAWQPRRLCRRGRLAR